MISVVAVNDGVVHRHCELKGHTMIITTLLDPAANLMARNASEKTTLNCESTHGHSNVAQVVLDNGALVEPDSLAGWVSCANGLSHCIDRLRILENHTNFKLICGISCEKYACTRKFANNMNAQLLRNDAVAKYMQLIKRSIFRSPQYSMTVRISQYPAKIVVLTFSSLLDASLSSK
ncbi:hypothetical protein Tcan_00154 [Toxocara canis]|uniref:Uncharacterized protein n=1 Tax=Toxocara canis TaxID=6265 RepID=A0A0B2V0W8_TOXCA|nr:hypothetical protein Tcan_00154 [Toxocara canis]